MERTAPSDEVQGILRWRQVMLSRAALTSQLADLGVGGRTPLMVHASLRRVGPIEGLLPSAMRRKVDPGRW